MATRGGPQRKGGRPGLGKASAKTSAKPKSRAKAVPEPATVAALPAGPFRLGAVPGATPGKWIDTWKTRMPRTPLELVPLIVAEQRGAFERGDVDAAIVRLPIDRDGLHVIPLYEETTVVVCAADSHLTAADELTVEDLAGEVRIVPRDDVLGVELPGTEAPRFAAPATTGEAIETVAAGVGMVVVPMSLARLHHRKDVTFRPLAGAPASAVALAWPADGTTELVDAFVGIVRGRTANSSR
ncbi:LysR substrate-binding domain-containing protein [Microbacterium sp. KSW4-11]|uniref:LysR substrate-binding domain-containing protein n=1 Tax=Microbacterium gawkjiense TaxID=3067309 RepID=A0ABU3G8J8_9MICO|nr:LysR substrate-binding domain-containing protein [Microbacterium sp. KSW4-11]MDT3315786.1 LysR substrate-binding domain-containing protein [Microbacterium sp. KSW4-11]